VDRERRPARLARRPHRRREPDARRAGDRPPAGPLHDAHAAYYDALHPLLLEGFAAATGGLLVRRGEAWVKQRDPAWRELAGSARRVVRRSRARAWLRWARIVATEPKLADLAANEALRKAGVRVRLTPRLRRHPLLFGLPEFVRVLRERDPHTPIGPPRG
jgi:hypothetical protein